MEAKPARSASRRPSCPRRFMCLCGACSPRKRSLLTPESCLMSEYDLARMAVDIATRWRDERRPETSKGSCGARRPDTRLRAIAAAPALTALSVFGAAFRERPAPRRLLL